MSVYVDPLLPCLISRQWRWPKSCHLIADTLEELHIFAKQIGLRREWFQKKQDFPHYDLNASRRTVAVRMGAIEITRREMVERYIENRRKRTAGEICGNPECMKQKGNCGCVNLGWLGVIGA